MSSSVKSDGTACDCNVSDVVVRAEGGLQLVARDVLAATTKIILFAVDKPEPALLIETPDVAGVEP